MDKTARLPVSVRTTTESRVCDYAGYISKDGSDEAYRRPQRRQRCNFAKYAPARNLFQAVWRYCLVQFQSVAASMHCVN